MRHLRFITDATLVAATSTMRSAFTSRLLDMRRGVAASLFACVCVFGTASSAGAFGLTGIGGTLGHVTPENLDGTMTIGAHLEFEQSGSRLHFVPSLMYWNANDISDLSTNADLYYHFLPQGLMTPYVGAGLGINVFGNERSDQSDTKLGANLFGGIRLPADRFHYFFEGRYTASEISQFAVLGGLTFRWSGR